MAAKPLTKEEKAWLKKLQAVLDECPSVRLGGMSTGMNDLTIFDESFSDKIDEIQTLKNREMAPVVAELGADLAVLNFPFRIQPG